MVTLKEWLDKFTELRLHEVSDATQTLHDSTHRHLLKCLGGSTPIEDITPAQADDFKAWLLNTKGVSLTTACSHVSKAKVAFERAVSRGMIPRNPFSGVSATPPTPVERAVDLTHAQVRAILSACPNRSWRHLVGLCALAGLRRGEALRLRQEDVDRGSRKIHVIPEGGFETSKARARVVYLEPELDALLDHEPGPLVVLSLSNLHRDMAAIVKAAGVPAYPKPFHALRAWRATTWREKFEEYQVDAMLGHSLAVARRHYVKLPDSFFAAQQ